MTQRLTAEREKEILSLGQYWGPPMAAGIRDLSTELNAVRAERDGALAKLEALKQPKPAFVGLAGMNFITNRERGSK